MPDVWRMLDQLSQPSFFVGLKEGQATELDACDSSWRTNGRWAGTYEYPAHSRLSRGEVRLMTHTIGTVIQWADARLQRSA